MLPKYEHTQQGSRFIYYITVFMILECLAIEAFVYIVGTRSSEPLPRNQLILALVLVPLVPTIILGWIFLMMSSLTVSIDHECVRIRFGAGMWKKKIPLDNIVTAESVKNNWSNGWGIRWLGRGRWLYNIAGLDAVEMTLRNSKKIRIGTDEPEKLAQAIKAAIA